ncbi:MAG: hypothetical protein M1830_005048 [Pleopsidium flavum]|nr:MAG: hypothetical protein M1830_005048 [Pleopsidium flavum]
MAPAKTAPAPKVATKQTNSKTVAKKAAPTVKSDAKVKKSTKKTDTGIKKAPSLYNIYCAFMHLSHSSPPNLCFGQLTFHSSCVTVKANYAQVKEENPELEPQEMMSKMGQLWKMERSNPKSENYDGPPVTKKGKK